jgi:thioesterase domain-containing protein
MDLISTAGYPLPDLAYQPGFSENIYQQLKQLPLQERLRSIWEQSQQWQILPTTFTLAQLQQLFYTFKTNYTAMRHYRPEQTNQRVLLFKPDEGRDTVEDASNGWSSLVERPLEIYMLPGNHYSFLKPPDVALLVQKIENSL